MAIVDVTSRRGREGRERREVRLLGRLALARVPGRGARQARRCVEERRRPGAGQGAGAADTADAKAAPKKPAGTLKLRDLAAGDRAGRRRSSRRSRSTRRRSSSPTSSSDPEGKGNGLFVKTLADAAASRSRRPHAEKAGYDNLTWSKDGASLAFSSVKDKDKPGEPADDLAVAARAAAGGHGRCQPAGAGRLDAAVQERPGVVEGRQATSTSASSRCQGGGRSGEEGGRHASAISGQAGVSPKPDPKGMRGRRTIPTTSMQILAKTEVDVWHWNDPRIIPQQKMLGTARRTATIAPCCTSPRLAGRRSWCWRTRTLPDVAVPDNARVALGISDVAVPASETTWGEARARRLRRGPRRPARASWSPRGCATRPSLSPDGRFVAFYDDRQWRLYDVATRRDARAHGRARRPAVSTRSTTRRTRRRRTASAGGWTRARRCSFTTATTSGRIPTAGGAPVNLTGGAGRRREITFRVVTLDPESQVARRAASRCC